MWSSVNAGVDFVANISKKVCAGERPLFPASLDVDVTGRAYRKLTDLCWHAQPDVRPTFVMVVAELTAMKQGVECTQGQ